MYPAAYVAAIHFLPFALINLSQIEGHGVTLPRHGLCPSLFEFWWDWNIAERPDEALVRIKKAMRFPLNRFNSCLKMHPSTMSILRVSMSRIKTQIINSRDFTGERANKQLLWGR